jgi:hypothetical protein
LRPKPKAIDPTAPGDIYGSGGLLAPLRNTNGLVFPYQPTITYQQDVNYSSVDLVHVNQELYAYTRTNAVKLTIQGQFTVQNQKEGIYAIACIHFLRTVTKMYFGASSNPGTPPPVLLFDAYGKYMFNQLPVIVTSFSVGLPNDVDYVPVDLSDVPQQGSAVNGPNTNKTTSQERNSSLNQFSTIADTSRMADIMYTEYLRTDGGEGYIWLPAVFNIDVSITVQNTPSRLRQFNLDTFRTGELLKNEGRWI